MKTANFAILTFTSLSYDPNVGLGSLILLRLETNEHQYKTEFRQNWTKTSERPWYLTVRIASKRTRVDVCGEANDL